MGQTDFQDFEDEDNLDYLFFYYNPTTDEVVYQLRHIDMDELECDMCGKQNSPRLREGGTYMCSACWAVWNG